MTGRALAQSVNILPIGARETLDVVQKPLGKLGSGAEILVGTRRAKRKSDAETRGTDQDRPDAQADDDFHQTLAAFVPKKSG